MNPVAMLRGEIRHSSSDLVGKALWVWCPGCDAAHRMMVERGPAYDGQPVWDWNGNLESPGVEPSILCTYSGPGGELTCHSFLRNGVWEFLGDSTHSLAGQSTPVVPLPDWLCDRHIVS